MKKSIHECTYEEFNEWCNRRACDGKWSAFVTMVCIEIINEVQSVKPLFFRKKAREKYWKEHTHDWFRDDVKIEV